MTTQETNISIMAVKLFFTAPVSSSQIRCGCQPSVSSPRPLTNTLVTRDPALMSRISSRSAFSSHAAARMKSSQPADDHRKPSSPRLRIWVRMDTGITFMRHRFCPSLEKVVEVIMLMEPTKSPVIMPMAGIQGVRSGRSMSASRAGTPWIRNTAEKMITIRKDGSRQFMNQAGVRSSMRFSTSRQASHAGCSFSIPLLLAFRVVLPMFVTAGRNSFRAVTMNSARPSSVTPR